jgi:hypothetical protein
VSAPRIATEEYMSQEKKKLLNKLKVLKDCVAEQEVHDYQCQLLHSQLNDLKLFSEKLSDACAEMITLMED